MTNYFLKHIPNLRSLSDNISKIILPATLAGIVFMAVSCEEKPSLIGNKLLPGTDFVTIESSLLDVRSYTMYRDSVSSQMPSLSYLGTIYDPYFGNTTGEFVSQLRLGSEWKGGNFYVDSVKLFLRFLSVTGDTSDQHFLRLSEIADIIYVDTTYYSSQTVPLTGFQVPDIQLPVLNKDTINFVELDVDPVLGGYLLRNPNMLFHRNDTADFRSYFRGLYFQLISPGDPLFVTLSVSSPSSGYYSNYFEVYGHDAETSGKTMTFVLDAVTKNASYNLYRHDHSAGETGKKLEHINDLTFLDTVSYVQTFNGVYTKLLLSDLDSIKHDPAMKNISVNRARLKIPVQYDLDGYLRTTLPSTLYLRYLTTSGSRFYVPETGTAFYDGGADTTSTSWTDDVYNLNIATFVQGYLEDEADRILPELELFLLPGAGHNVILKANGSYKPIKFEFTYTRF